MFRLLYFIITILIYTIIYKNLNYKEFVNKYSPVLPTNNANTLDISNESLQPKKMNWLDSLYFSLITQATIGYGDIVPRSKRAKIIVITQVLFSFLIISIELQLLFDDSISLDQFRR